jgi:hypothetical protein
VGATGVLGAVFRGRAGWFGPAISSFGPPTIAEGTERLQRALAAVVIAVIVVVGLNRSGKVRGPFDREVPKLDF